MGETKYIVVETNLGGSEAIIFGSLLSHKEVARGYKVLSAGFCTLGDNDKYTVWGKSVSLGIKSKSEHAWLLNKLV